MHAASSSASDILPQASSERRGAALQPLLRGEGCDYRGAWLPPLFVVPLVALLVYQVLPRLPFPPADANAGVGIILPAWANRCKPEPLEQAQYLTALVLIPLLSWVMLFLVRPLLHGRDGLATPASRAILYGAVLLTQALLIAMVVFHVRRQWQYDVHHQFNIDMFYFLAGDLFIGCGIAAVIAMALVVGARLRRAAWLRGFRFSLGEWLAFFVAMIFTAVCLLPALQTFRSYPRADDLITYHLAFTLGDFASVYNGRTPLVNFIPQYQILSPYLLFPWFRVVGLSVVTFTFTCTAFSLTGLLFHYHILRRVTASRLVALALYLPIAAFSIYTIVQHPDHGQPPDSVLTNYFSEFTYYANAPLRYFGPWVMTWLLIFLPERPSFKIMTAYLGLGSICVINNPDFGLPALAGAVLCLLLLGPRGPFPPASHWLKVAGALAVGFLTAVILFTALTCLHGGALPKWGYLLDYQRLFAIVGFGMLPMPPAGIHIPIFLTFLAAVYVPIASAAADRSEIAVPREAGRMLLYRALLFSGVLGAGAFSYYAGRSHPYNLPVVFPVWSFCIMLLLYAHFSWFRGAFAKLMIASRLAQALPAALLVACYVLCAAWLVKVAPPVAQWQRLRDRLPGDLDYRHEEDRLVQIIKQHTKPGEEVCIVYPMGHLLAQRAGVVNVFPFATNKSILAYSQLNFALDELRSHHVRHFFFGAATPYADQIRALGVQYTPMPELPHTVVDGPFGVGELIDPSTAPASASAPPP